MDTALRVSVHCFDSSRLAFPSFLHKERSDIASESCYRRQKRVPVRLIAMMQCQVQPVTYENFDPSCMTICCVPSLCHVGEPIHFDNLSEAVKIICNNENCSEGEYMHKICFDQWECSVLTYLRSTGRARSWSEKQRLQNLWTKKGYDLAYKACGCKCGKGHLRKDLDWASPAENFDDAKRKKNRRRKNDKPCLAVTSVGPTAIGKASVPQLVPPVRMRTSSLSSASSASGSPPNSADIPMSPTWSAKGFLPDLKKDRTPSDSIFTRRQDFSSFNMLPRNKINAYHIKVEDEGNQGNDEIRCFILSTFSAHNTTRINCILCDTHMMVFDRYPLIDGTFFLSPCQYSSTSLPVQNNFDVQFLNALCMGCLEGWNTILQCKYCGQRWDGSDLILGTMYSYDVLAAKCCCDDRKRCGHCHQAIIFPEALQFFSDYSRHFPCPFCCVPQYHFIKPLATYYLLNNTL